MAVNVGDTSGCLEVIKFENSYIEDIFRSFRPEAEKVWTGDLQQYDWTRERYNLSEEEMKKCLEKKEMPESFIEKYMAHCYFQIPFLYHKKNPNTICELRDAFEKKKLIKVRCTRCGRTFFTDEESFKCVKWQRCLKVECDKSIIVQNEEDYSQSLYQWNEESTALQVMNNQIAKVDDITRPLPYYNSLMKNGPKVRVAYISDMHLLHHLRMYENDWKKLLITVSSDLYQSSKGADILLFNGDIASKPEMVIMFFQEFVKQYAYKEFKQFLEDLRYYKWFVSKYLKKESEQYKLDAKCPTESKLERIEKYIQSLYEKMSMEYGFDYKTFIQYRNQYCSWYSFETAYSMYKKTNGYKKQKIQKSKETQVEQLVLHFKECEEIAGKYRKEIERFYRKIERRIEEISDFEEKYGLPVLDINISSFKRKYNLKDDYGVIAYVVLGNHEFIDFPSIQSGVDFYRETLGRLGIRLLQNETVRHKNTCKNESQIVIYGGTGFAKYNQQYNANSVRCCQNFTREYEISETEKFEEGYRAALEYAKKNNSIFICASHYPVDSCLNNHFDVETVYFTGHNHRNEYIYTETKALYADNQIGYKSNRISFKIADIGTLINPYYFLKDGLYATRIDTYLDFCRYLGECVGDGAALYKKCNGKTSNLYVVKHKGYYGFFVVTSAGSTRGIFVVNGGKMKKITSSTNLSWICENFDIVLIKYLQLLTPLRILQERISEELQELGLYGTIHGTIVDIDFYHHIMVNPLDGTITFYFSPEFGLVQNLDTFDDVIKSLEEKESQRLINKEKYKAKIQEGNCLLSKITKGYLIENCEVTEEIFERENPLQSVSRSEGAYGVSRKVSSLQRLFDGKVLRDFDIRLTETKQEAHRKISLIGREFCYDGIEYKVIEDDGSDIIVAEEKKKFCETQKTEIQLANTKRFSVVELKAKIRSQSMTNLDTYWLE